jgi:hypothetical protein
LKTTLSVNPWAPLEEDYSLKRKGDAKTGLAVFLAVLNYQR